MKVTLQNLGKKETYGGEVPTIAKSTVQYPEIWLDDKNFSGIEGLSAGQALNLMFVGEVKMVEQVERTEPDGTIKKCYSARICLKQGAIVPKAVEVPKTTLQAFTKAVKEIEYE